jgi:hypothetical protein
MMSLRIRRSLTRSASAAPNTSGRMLSKKLAMSASTTQQRPRLTSTRIASNAWWALRPGRKPNEQSRTSASQIGSSTAFAAACTTRSPTAGTVISYCPSCRHVSGCFRLAKPVLAGPVRGFACCEHGR